MGYSSPGAEGTCETSGFNSSLSTWNAVVSMPNTAVTSLDGATVTTATTEAHTGVRTTM
ncbi:unnamed protein product [Dibothriocephalus latus]|uniref:Uncharacterized protein n=1 Tax=Dibothriocephalus latus TaxID=60516 RepID=A0A3P7QIY2_DIBLA|nr:unnamed protein product [Dibothriocephalus latus]